MALRPRETPPLFPRICSTATLRRRGPQFTEINQVVRRLRWSGPKAGAAWGLRSRSEFVPLKTHEHVNLTGPRSPERGGVERRPRDEAGGHRFAIADSGRFSSAWAAAVGSGSAGAGAGTRVGIVCLWLRSGSGRRRRIRCHVWRQHCGLGGCLRHRTSRLQQHHGQTGSSSVRCRGMLPRGDAAGIATTPLFILPLGRGTRGKTWCVR